MGSSVLLRPRMAKKSSTFENHARVITQRTLETVYVKIAMQGLWLRALLLFTSFAKSTCVTPCPSVWDPSRAIPTNASDVAPQDVSRVAALGDSITAGFGMHGWADGLQSANEDRGRAWSIGGDAAWTLPALLNQNRPSASRVLGASRGLHAPEVCALGKCSPHRASDALNAAQSGAVAANMPAQASYITELVKSTPALRTDGWTLVTILVGANDLCVACGPLLSPDERTDAFELHLRDALTTLAAQPRTIVVLEGPITFVSGPNSQSWRASVS